ncbi:MAG: N-acetyltransferase family protein [Bacteroidota bacterium]
MIETLVEKHWPAVKVIYVAGMQTGHATFEQPNQIASFASWQSGKLTGSTIVFVEGEKVLGWAALSPVSDRCVYAGVAEVSVYVAADVQGKGIGSQLLMELIRISEAQGIWTLQAGIMTENAASIRLHEKCGFRRIGVREKLGQLNGQWRDVMLLERRSLVVG